MTAHENVSPRRDSELLLAAAVVAVVAWLIFHPERARPFDALDFGEFIPLLKRSSNALTQLQTLIGYYAAQLGRVNLVQLMAIVLKWQMFGEWTPGWQLLHALVMFVPPLQTYLLVRRVGATFLGALIAALTMVVTPAATDSWIRLTASDPGGVVVILALSLRAFRYQSTTNWTREVWLMCVGLIFAVLTKEMLAPVFVLPLTIALTSQPDGHFASPRWSRRDYVLVAALSGVAVLVVAYSLIVMIGAGRPAFSAQYGHDFQSLGQVLAIWIGTLIPFGVSAFAGSIAWLLALLAITVLLASGWRIGFCDAREGRRARRLLAGAVLFPLVGALVYAPWQFYAARYAYPYLIGTAVFLAMATTYLQRWPTAIGHYTALVATVVAGVFSTAEAWASAGQADALQRAVDEVIHSVHVTADSDSVFMTAPQRPRGLEWMAVGPSMARLALATDRPWPPLREIRCADVTLLTGRAIIVDIQSFCNDFPASAHVVTSFTVVDWYRWSIAEDSVYFDLMSVPNPSHQRR